MPTVMLRIDPRVKKRLDTIRIHHRETYGDIIERLIDEYTRVRPSERIPETGIRDERPMARPRTISAEERHEIDID